MLKEMRSVEFLTFLAFVSAILLYSTFIYGRPMRIFEKAESAEEKKTMNMDLLVSEQETTFEKTRRLYLSQADDRRQKLNSYTENSSYGLFYNVIVPEVFCPELVRVGNTGDGGKWTCNIFDTPKDNCSIFSLGINGDISFDIAFQDATDHKCRLFAFDKDDQTAIVKGRLKQANGEFKVALLGNVTDEKTNKFTMEYLMNFYGLRRVEILKMDIEGAEFAVLPSILPLQTCQILIEIHGAVKQVIKLLKLMSSFGYYLFSYEINGYYHDLAEYSVIHESCFEQYKVRLLARYLS